MTFEPKKHLRQINGKDYLDVKWRIVWFKDAQPDGAISTDIVNVDPPVIKATIYVNGVIIATGHGSVPPAAGKQVWAGREFEKAETAAIGRALAHAGYGTQFTDDVEDGPADSPVERKPSSKPAPHPTRLVKPAAQSPADIIDAALADEPAQPNPFTKGMSKRDIAYERTKDTYNYGARKHFDNLMTLLANTDKVHAAMNVDEIVDAIDAHYAAKALEKAG